MPEAWLTTDQLFNILVKLSCSSPRRILYISQIHVMVISEMNRRSLRVTFINIHQKAIFTTDLSEDRLLVFQRFSDHVVDVIHLRDVVWRKGKEVFQGRSFITATFLEF